jgi:hypothetical protein
MKGFDRGCDLRVSGPGRLDEAEPFPRDLNLALPAVGALNRTDNLDAGGEAMVDQRPSDATGNVPAGRRRGYLDEFLHYVSVRAGWN